MSGTNDRKFDAARGKMESWQDMDTYWEAGKRQRAAPFLDAFDQFGQGLLDRAGLERESGAIVERQYLDTFMPATRSAYGLTRKADDMAPE